MKRAILIAIIIGVIASAALIIYIKLRGKKVRETFDPMTEKNLRSLNPDVAERFRRILKKGRDKGYDLRLISGQRTCREQDKLYDQGRDTPGNIVTNAPCGKSFHNYGLAGDFAFYKDGVYWQKAPWQTLGNWCKAEGFEWGGDWKSLVDPPHCQDPKDNTIAQLYNKYKQTGSLSIS